MTLIAERRVVVTGKIAGESRQTAEAKLRDAGAIVQTAVNKDTDILVIGAAVGAKKMNAARNLGVTIVTWDEAFGSTGGSKAAAAPRAPMPAVHQWAPMLCKPIEELPTGSGWIFEIKWDGLRGIATIKDGQVNLQSRSGKTDLTERYPLIVEELSGLPDCVLDGELVALSGDLAKPGQLTGVPSDDGVSVARFIIYDILELRGEKLTPKSLAERRGELAAVVDDEGLYVAISPAFTDGEEVLDYVRAARLEGVVAKRLASPYIEGGRNDNWLKLKVRPEQEFLVLGWTLGEGSRATTFGALILGYYENGVIRYAGKVGTGFDDDCLEILRREMDQLLYGAPEGLYDETKLPVKLIREGVFVHPELVVQVAFQKWTEDRILFQPSYLGLREDKDASEVVRET